MPRIKGIPRQFDPRFGSRYKSEADPAPWRETETISIERTMTTMFKCDPTKTTACLQAKRSAAGKVTHNFLEAYVSETGASNVDQVKAPFTILIPSLSFPFPAKLPIPPLGLGITSVAATTAPAPMTSTPPDDTLQPSVGQQPAGDADNAAEQRPKKTEKPAKTKDATTAATGTAVPTEAPKVVAGQEGEEEGNEAPDSQLSSPPLLPPSSRYYLPERMSTSAKRDRDKEIITCAVCEKTMRRGSLREHMDRHENSGKFECHLCGKTFSRASAREKHIRTHTGERPYVCAICPKSYRQKVHLNEHMRSHTGERPFVCRLCGFSLTSKSLLNRHLRTHGVSVSANDVPEMWLRTDAPTEQVLAAAAEVGRSLAEAGGEGAEAAAPDSASGEADGEKSPSSALRVTALNGTATVAALARRHLCNVCPAGFPTLQALRSHRLTTHGLMTPHVCPTCAASFTSLKLMKVHCRKAHPQICPICDEKMPQRRRWILELHLRDKHPGVSPDSLLGPSPMALGRAKRARRPAEESDTSVAAAPKPPKISRGKTAPRDCNENEEQVEVEKAGAERGEEDPDNNTDTINHTESRPAVSVRLKLELSTDFMPPLVDGDDTHQAVDPAGPLPGPQGSALSPSDGVISPPAGD